MARASENLLDGLHSLVAEGIAADIKAFRDKGEPVPPQLYDKALKFLKDNGVDTPAKSERVDSLAGQLRDLDLDDEAVRVRPN